MFVATCLHSNREKDTCNYGGFAARDSLLHQRLPRGTKNITGAKFTNNNQRLLAVKLEHISLLSKYTAMLKQGLVEKLIKAVVVQVITPGFRGLDYQ